MQQRATALRPRVTRRSRRMPLQAWNACRLGTRRMLQCPVPQTALPLGRSSRRIRLKDERVFLVYKTYMSIAKIPYLSVLYTYIYIYMPISAWFYIFQKIHHYTDLFPSYTYRKITNGYIDWWINSKLVWFQFARSMCIAWELFNIYMRIRSFTTSGTFVDPIYIYGTYGYPARPKSAWKDSSVACFRRVASSVPWFENSVRTMLAALRLYSPLSCKAKKHFILNRVPIDASSADQT